MTNHTNCEHAATKSARAKCRRENAAAQTPRVVRTPNPKTSARRAAAADPTFVQKLKPIRQDAALQAELAAGSYSFQDEMEAEMRRTAAY